MSIKTNTLPLSQTAFPVAAAHKEQFAKARHVCTFMIVI